MFNLPWRIHWANPLVIAAVLVLLAAAVKVIQPLLYWPVEGVRIVGKIDHVDRTRLQYALADTLNQGFLAADLNEVRESVEALPWVDQAKVRRNWPEEIEIALTEKKPLANWLQKGFLDSNLVAFFPANYSGFEGLPKLAGPSGSERKVWDFYQAIDKQLAPLGLKADVVSLAKHGAWTVHLQDGPWLLIGKEHTPDRLRRVPWIYDALKTRWADVRLVDIRYPNGFSVEWLQENL